MKRILNKIFVLAAIFIVSNGSAQTLQEFINTAIQNNYQIKIVKNESIIAENNNTLGNAGFLPSLDIAGGYSNSFNNTKQVFADGTIREGSGAKNTNLNMSALMNWTVFNGFRVFAKQDQLGYLQTLGELNSKFYIEQTVADITTAYYQLVYEKKILENFEQSLEISAFRLKIARKKQEIGSATIIDYGQAMVDYQTDSIRILAQQNTIQSLIIELNRIANNPLEQPIKIQNKTFEAKILPSIDSLKYLISENNNQLAQQRLQELIAETELRITQANRYPSVNLFAGFQYNKNTAEVGFSNSNQTFGPTIGVNVSFNLFNGGNTKREIKNNMLFAENSTLTKNQITNDVDANVLSSYYQYQSVTNQISLAQNNVAQMNKINATAQEQFKRGAINGYDFRLTQLILLENQLKLTQLQFTLKTIEINLNRLSGKILEVYL
ncbi:TolC family protein [Flexithrix dorotheae]|uniref:TolC family protein n=1 Tax=Flexithrix dorotheae TaxID=70993 RepID=UPI000362FD34|nr:TolC family protein [Flexithrix dorotheae]